MEIRQNTLEEKSKMHSSLTGNDNEKKGDHANNDEKANDLPKKCDKCNQIIEPENSKKKKKKKGKKVCSCFT